MCWQYRNLLTLGLCFLWLPASFACNMEGMQVCHYNEELNRRSYDMLFNQSFMGVSQSCQRQKYFLDCAYKNEHTVGCSFGNLVPLHSLNSTHHAVCGNNLAAYNRSRPCILQTKDSVHQCLRPFWKTRHSHCQELIDARKCIQNSASKKEECSSQDIRFLGKVIDSSLIPYAHPEVKNCDMTIFGGGEGEATTQTEMRSSTMYTTFQDSTPSTGIPTENKKSPASTIMTAKMVDEREAPIAVALGSTGENSSIRCSLSASAVSIMILTVLSTWF